MLSQYTNVAVVMGHLRSRRRFLIQQVSATTLATPLYSASALERETVSWRFEDQDMRLLPKKMQ
ncbi:hypothetical protein Bca101_019943 [Brassica carinata]